MSNSSFFAGASGDFHTFQFRAMNTRIDMAFYCKSEQAARLEETAAHWFQNTEERFSRFREQSELSHLNRLAGERCMVSDAMMEVLRLADAYRELTGGAFDPLILNALHAAGYSESFELLKQHPDLAAAEPAKSVQGSTASMQLNPVMKSVQLPAQSGLDLGGIVKSWAVRRLAEHLRKELFIERGFVNAGGDLAAWGPRDEVADPWRIGIEHPWDTDADAGIIALVSGAAATSSKLGRKWAAAAGPMHHLIDPRTMRPSDSDVAQCTVTGKDVVACEVWAKAICILGLDDGLELFARKAEDCEALVFTQDRQSHLFASPESIGTRWQGVRYDHFREPARA
ncbi:FAD:protein FMN transferase [Paenibacillus hamazuiensis]|uniref:FAD:protein FMN transferase n=1 Tax=Paenibacillus hamazuiensis TaxID=2936508 RepID=UPI00200FF96A|nr:FAD:protein FMN transferase [Paenibacillus hamazuiensis]